MTHRVSTKRRTMKLYHGTRSDRADAIVRGGFDLGMVRPRWVNDYAVSTLTSPLAVQRYFGDRGDRTVLEMTFRGVVATSDEVRALVPYSSGAVDYTRRVRAAGIDAVVLDGSGARQVFVYNPDALTDVRVWTPARVARGKAKKDVGHGGLDEWFSGHGGDEGDATWGDWVAISPVKKKVEQELADGTVKEKTVKPGDIVGPCGVSDDPNWKSVTRDGKDPLKCMPRQKAHDTPRAERAELAREKMKAERDEGNRGKEPTRTRTFDKKAGDNEPTDPDLWEEAKDKARERYTKWPSAYAVGHALKIYKDEGGGWRKKAGWWQTPDGLIGDGPADVMQTAVDRVRRLYRDHPEIARDPSVHEVQAVVDFVTGPDRDAATAPPGVHTLPPLPYAYDALEPYISEETLRFHHDRHHRAYVDGLNEAERALAAARRDGDLAAVQGLNAAMQFNAGGHVLHSLYWPSLTPDYAAPSPALVAAVEADFGSWDAFRAQLRESTVKVRGSGWGVLVWTPSGLRIVTVMNHENGVLWDGAVLLPVDAWEHAYYIDHRNDRGAHFDAVFDHLVDWATVERRLVAARRRPRVASGTVTYKGKPYRLLWRGPTRYGERARLQFMDGSKDFWVDAHMVSGGGSYGGGSDSAPRLRRDGTYLCDECGDYVRPGTSCWETGMRH